MRRLVMLLSGLLLYSNSLAFDNKQEAKEFNLHIRFVIPYSVNAWPDSAVKAWIEPRISFAEEIFDLQPSLRITYEVKRVNQMGGLDLQSLVFRSNRHFHKFMKKHFPIVAKDSINGFFPIIVSEKFQILKPQKRLCGKTFLPSKAKLFGKRHGMALKRYCALSVFAHELGHIFKLSHTYQKSLNGGCNKGFKKGNKGKRASANYENRVVNLMDSPIDGFKAVLNECQKQLAAKERMRYLNVNNKLDYQLFKKK